MRGPYTQSKKHAPATERLLGRVFLLNMPSRESNHSAAVIPPLALIQITHLTKRFWISRYYAYVNRLADGLGVQLEEYVTDA